MPEWLTHSLYRWENWSKERWRNLSRATSWLWIHSVGFRYYTANLYTYEPEIELIFTVSLRMLKSVFFSLSLPGNLRSLLDLPNVLSAALISAPYLSSPVGPMLYKQVGLIWHKLWPQAAGMKHLPSVAQRVGLSDFRCSKNAGAVLPFLPRK